jgi:hypothetical protein
MPLIIIGQLDKTFIDSKGKLTLEPLKISLHIFKEEVRRHDFAWRPLGYISNQANLPKYKNPQEKARDYQFIVATVIKSLKDFQQKYDVFLWDMVIHGSMVHIAFHPVFGYMIGDNEGHDKTCGKYLNRQKVVRLCRYCSTPLEETDNPFFTDWEYTNGSYVARLVREKKLDELKEISYHCIENAMQGLKFADPIRGINGATPAERLHVLNHGLFQMIMEYNFGQKRAKITQKKILKVIAMEEIGKNESPSDNQSVHENDEEDFSSVMSDYEESSIVNELHESKMDKKPEATSSTTPSPLSNISLFTPSICDQFDSDAKKYGRILQKQSSRYWKRSFFYHGVTNNSRKVGHEERNCLLLCLLIYTSSRYEHYSNTLDPEKKKKRKKCDDEPLKTKRLDYLIELLSETLLLENFMMQKGIPKSTVDTLEKYIPLYLSFLKDVCPRQAGMGWKLTKFHVLNHLASDIKRLSIPMNFDSNVVESHHKEEKKSGNRTQKRASEVDKQTAIRRTEEMLIDRAYNAVYPPPSFHLDNKTDLFPTTDLGFSLFSSQKLSYVKKLGICYVNRYGCPTTKVARFPENEYLLHQINSFFEQLFANALIPAEGVPIYTRNKVFHKTHNHDEDTDTILYRGDPLWTSSHDGGTAVGGSESKEHYIRKNDPWHDFAYVSWKTKQGGNLQIPARILFFLEIPDGMEGEDENKMVYQSGSYALVQSCVEELNACPPISKQAKQYFNERYGSQSKLVNYLAHPSCSILFWTLLETTDFSYGLMDNDVTISVPKLYLVEEGELCGSCIAVPYNLEQKPTIEWLVVRNREEWDEIFVSDMEIRVEDGS